MFQNKDLVSSGSSGDLLCCLHKESHLVPILVSVGPSLCDRLNALVVASTALFVPTRSAK